jgi:tripartite-type tricarboxylate transporter receptor subunit TctC
MHMVAKAAIIGIMVGAAFASGAARTAGAQDWPTRALTMVVGFAPSGGTDVLGRIIGRRLAEVLAQQVVIENVGGAGGMVGSAR